MKQTKLWAITMALTLGVGSAFAQPSNDDCSSAQSLTIGSIVDDHCVTGTNVDATLEASAYDSTAGCWASDPDATVWYKFTVSATSSYTITTDVDDSEDTQIKLYSTSTGDCDSLVEIGCSEDFGICSALAAEITDDLDPGTYYVQVDLFGTDPEDQGSFTIGVYDNDDATTLAYDCFSGAVDISFMQAGLDTVAYGETGPYPYFNVQQEIIHPDDISNPYTGCNNNPQVPEFFGVWFKFKYDENKPNAWLSVHAIETPKCDGGESENIFYTLHLFKEGNNSTPSGTCGEINIGADGSGWCSVGDGNFSDDPAGVGERDKAGNSFYGHPRLDLSQYSDLVHDSTYYVMVAQMTRYTVETVTREEFVGFDPVTGDSLFVTVIENANNIAEPSNGLFYLTYEDATNVDNLSEDLCSDAQPLPTAYDANNCFSNVAMQGNVQTSVYDTPVPVNDEPLGYNGCNSGRGYLEECHPDSAVIIGECLAWENHNSAIYTFEIPDPALDTIVCISKEDLKTDVLTLIDLVCPALYFTPRGLPTIFDPQTGDPLLSLGDSIADAYGSDTIALPDTSVCNAIKLLICSIIDDPSVPEELCFQVNCSPRTEVYFERKNACCGEGSPKLVVLDDCVGGNVAMWSDIDCEASCVTLSSGLTPFAPGEYFVVVEGDGVVLEYNLWVDITYAYGLGGATCTPNALMVNEEPENKIHASGIEDRFQAVSNLSLHPVPASDALNLTFTANDAQANVSIQVLDVSGRSVVISEQISVVPGKNTHSIDLSTVSNGVYMLNVKSGGKSSVTRFVVSK